MARQELYFDTSKFSQSDFARILLENRNAELEKRISPYEISFDEEGNPNFPLRYETKTDFIENEALFKLRDLALSGKKYILWMSPPSPEAGYTESRLVVAIAKERGKGKSIKFESRGICGHQSAAECLKIGENLTIFEGEERKFRDGNELRGSPIAFTPAYNEDWIDHLSHFIDMPQVWQAIRKSKDDDNLRETQKIAAVIESRFGRRMSQVKGGYEKVQLGAEIEAYVTNNFGIRLMAGGEHGVSNAAMLENMHPEKKEILIEGGFKQIFLRSEVRNEAGRRICPVCKVEVGEGVHVCPKCNYRMNDIH